MLSLTNILMYVQEQFLYLQWRMFITLILYRQIIGGSAFVGSYFNDVIDKMDSQTIFISD